MHLAFFISPHGFGHAARSAALMEAVHRRTPAVRFTLYTRVPRWFFSKSLPCGFDYVECLSDIGLSQASALEIDLSATERALAKFFPFREETVASLARSLCSAGCDAVVCDISPLGIAAARAAGVPAILVENFTWDWIYEHYFELAPGLESVARGLATWFDAADLHVQTEPVCRYREHADHLVGPMCRTLRDDTETVRKTLGLDPGLPLVVITQGGMLQPLSFLDALRERRDLQFLVSGMSRTVSDGNLRCLNNTTIVYMPDVVAAADAVVGKLGYSIVAETWQAGAPMGYVPREDFRESAPLAAFVEREMSGIRFPRDVFESGAWVPRLDELLALPRKTCCTVDGSRQAAQHLLTFLA